ncbi:MAG: hypothetical protein LJU34_04935 [Oscillospiraceae bacterium]|nr:hypothetical protein [Oscillospiraceae bacterium]
MKKLISLLMVLTLMVGLFSCLGVTASADAEYEFTFLVTSAAGVEDDDYSDIADVRTAYIEERGDAMLVSVDAGSDAYSMYVAGYELAWADPYSLDNYFTGIYPDGGTYDYDNQGTTWVEIGLPVGGDYADEEGYAAVYFVAVGGEDDETTLASFADAEGYVVAIGPWSAAEAVEAAEDVDMFWTVVDEDDLAELASSGYMIGETLVVNAGSTADSVAVVSIADGVISLENLNTAAVVEETSEGEEETTDAAEEVNTITLMIEGYDSITWTEGSEEEPSVTCEAAVEALYLYIGEDLLQTLTEGEDYVLTNDGMTITLAAEWLDSLFADEIHELISDDVTLTIVPEYAAAEDETGDADTDTAAADDEETADEDEEAADDTTTDTTEEETATITLADEAEQELSWDADSSEELTVALGEDSSLESVTVDGVALTEGTDYTYDADTQTVTFDSDWLSSLEAGTYEIVLSAVADDSGIMLASEDDTTTVTLTLTVTKTSTTDDTDNTTGDEDDTSSATIATDSESESWDLGGTADLTVTLAEGSTLESVTVDGTTLTAGTDYDYDESTLTLTIYASYLNTLEAGEYTITLSAGTDSSATITLSAVAVTTISVTSDTAAWTLDGTDESLTITLGAAVASLESVTIDGTAVEEGSAGYDYDADVTVTIDATVLNALTAGDHTIVLTDGEGGTATVTLTVSSATEATATPSPTPTATASPTPTAEPSYTYTWSRGTGDSLTIDLGKSVSKIDIYSGSTFYREATLDEDYTLSGTSITFSASMVNNDDGTAFWADGTYMLLVTFTDGTTQEIYLKLTDAATTATTTATATAEATASEAPATSGSGSPSTGDTTNIALYVVILIVLVVALAVVIIIVMKNKKQNEAEQARAERYTRPAQPEDDGIEEDYDVSDIDDDNE